MPFPSYQDLTEILQTRDFVEALIQCSTPPGGVDDNMVPWSINLGPALLTSLTPAVDPNVHAVIFVVGSNVSAIAQADPAYPNSLTRNPNIREGVGAWTWFGGHVVHLIGAPTDRLTVVAVTLDEEHKPVITASNSTRIACRIASLMPQDVMVRTIAAAAHEFNRQYCLSQGDDSQPTWADAPDWQRDSAMNGVRMHLDNPNATPEDSHISWMTQKEAEGWVYGEVKDPEAKTHPCMVPYADLPSSQRAKDYLFRSTVHQLAAILKPLSF